MPGGARDCRRWVINIADDDGVATAMSTPWITPTAPKLFRTPES